MHTHTPTPTWCQWNVSIITICMYAIASTQNHISHSLTLTHSHTIEYNYYTIRLRDYSIVWHFCTQTIVYKLFKWSYLATYLLWSVASRTAFGNPFPPLPTTCTSIVEGTGNLPPILSRYLRCRSCGPPCFFMLARMSCTHLTLVLTSG